ncbi:class II aldolase/adducin family protein [Serinicoccus sp. LYQ131]|uniref:class II aldolase/adducin family protein n=1 Tax=Serinicoccus sp. LYQ131 TaxID=3378797 RepID=UPI0038555DDA
MSATVEQLCWAGRHLAELGLSPGASGNISVRVGPEVHLTPSGSSLSTLDPTALSRMTLTADGLEHTGGPRPSKEYGLHGALYVRDPEAVCVVHLHSPYAVAASCLPAWAEHSALPPLTPYLLMRVGNLPMVPYAPPGDAGQAVALRDHAVDCHGALLQNHGPVVAGASVEEAVARAIEIEQAARVTLSVGQRPEARLLAADEVEHLTTTYGQPWGVTTTV